jgi:hypothetical protein
MTCPSCVRTPPKPSLLESMQTVKYLLGSSTLRIGVVVNSIFNLSKMSSHFCDQVNLIPFFCRDVIGYTILENPSINIR